MKNLLSNLNPEQVNAVKHHKGPCMVYAGPGSGKTTVLTYRIWYLINYYKVNPSKILAVTFTKASSEEMKQKFNSLWEPSQFKSGNVNFGTFHSTFFKIIKRYCNYSLNNVLGEGDRYNSIKTIVKSIDDGTHEDDEYIKDILLDISLYKSEHHQRVFSPQSMSKEDFFKLLEQYEENKRINNKIDFDDMLLKCYDLLKDNPRILAEVRSQFQYILIDEFQDINTIQFEIVKLITEPRNNLFVVGDDDQSIYSFRGANPHFIVSFHKIYENTKKVILNRNYRSQEKIIKIANNLIVNNKRRVAKEIIPTISKTVDIKYLTPMNKEEENKDIVMIINNLIAKGYNYNDIAITYRTNLAAASVINQLLENKIPYVARDQVYNIYEHWVAKDIISYIKATIHHYDIEAIRRIINRPTRYITRKSLSKVSSCDGSILNALKDTGELKPYQLEKVEKLERDFIKMKCLNTFDLIRYIRKEINYDKHIEDYCIEKSIAKDKLFEVMDELENLAKKHLKLEEFIQHISNFNNTLNKRNHYIIDDNKINLLTMHSAKGLEYKAVVILSVVEGIIPHHRSVEDENLLEEERRLFYVAITRAKEYLYVSSPLYKNDKKLVVSQFIEEMTGNKEKAEYRKEKGKRDSMFGSFLSEDFKKKIMKSFAKD